MPGSQGLWSLPWTLQEGAWPAESLRGEDDGSLIAKAEKRNFTFFRDQFASSGFCHGIGHNYRLTRVASLFLIGSLFLFGLFFFPLKNVFKFVIILKESRGGAKREGDRESQAGSALSAQSPAWGLDLRNREIVT